MTHYDAFIVIKLSWHFNDLINNNHAFICFILFSIKRRYRKHLIRSFVSSLWKQNLIETSFLRLKIFSIRMFDRQIRRQSVNFRFVVALCIVSPVKCVCLAYELTHWLQMDPIQTGKKRLFPVIMTSISLMFFF